jgi:acyl carrier protein
MDSLEKCIKDWIAEKFNSEIDLNKNFFDLGLFDSLSFAEMIVAVETFLKKDIDFSEITDWHEVTTTAGLINHIYKSNQIK